MFWRTERSLAERAVTFQLGPLQLDPTGAAPRASIASPPRRPRQSPSFPCESFLFFDLTARADENRQPARSRKHDPEGASTIVSEANPSSLKARCKAVRQEVPEALPTFAQTCAANPAHLKTLLETTIS